MGLHYLGLDTEQAIERTNSWHNAHKKLVWCTERRGEVIDFWIAFSDAIIIMRRLIREAWGPATAGKLGLLADHDLLAQALKHLSSKLDHRIAASESRPTPR